MSHQQLFYTDQDELFGDVLALPTRTPSQIRTLAVFADYLEGNSRRRGDEL